MVHLVGNETHVERDDAGRVLRIRPAMLQTDVIKKSFEPLLTRSALASWMMRRMKPVILDWVDGLNALARTGAGAPPPGPAPALDTAEATTRLTALLTELKATAPVVVLDIPHVAYRPGRRAERAAVDESVVYRDAAQRAGAEYVDAFEALSESYARSGQPGHGFPNNYVGVGHLNERGHEAVASALTKTLSGGVSMLGPSSPHPGGPPGTPLPPSAPPQSHKRRSREAGLTPLAPSSLSAVWANEGGDKVARDELRESGSPGTKAGRRHGLRTRSLSFDGRQVNLSAATNETVSAQLILESASITARQVSVRFDQLRGTGSVISSRRATAGGDLYDWSGRPIEVFVVRYLQIRGLSLLTWGLYDERHIPERFQRAYDARGRGNGAWGGRPDADALYPDIAVPAEAVPSFEVPVGMNQAIWIDIWVPKDATPGTYRGDLEIAEAGNVTWRVPVALTVHSFTLPDVPTAKSFLQLGYADINQRYLGKKYPDVGDPLVDSSRRIRDRHFQMAHRHRIALIDGNAGPEVWNVDAPRPDWQDRLDGSLFRPERGYDGPGVGVGNGIFSIGTYGQWGWKDEDDDGMRAHLDRWAKWFAQNAPETDVFLYLIDESQDYERIERWAKAIRNNPGPGKSIRGFATLGMPWAVGRTPSLDIACSTLKVGQKDRWERALAAIHADPRKRSCLYNGGRPATGSLALDDDGVAMRQLGWTQFKFRIDRWFIWESTYYNNFQGGRGETNVLQTAQTFGGTMETPSPELGVTGWNYTNGDGVLFYPGTDTLFPQDSFELPGPLASLRLKHWRRGLQDHDYLTMAESVDPKRTRDIVNKLIPKVLWENDIQNPLDPTYVHCPISWSTDPDAWERARAELAAIITRASVPGPGSRGRTR